MKQRPAIKHSTYKVVGPLERVDERDTIFARAFLDEGSGPEKAYHANHPDTRAVDLKMARFYRRDTTPCFGSVFGPIASLALPDMVDGLVSDNKVSRSRAQFTSLVKEVAVSLGADLVGIGILNQAWVYTHRGRHPYFENYRPNLPLFSGVPPHYSGLEWGDPIRIDHKYVIAMAFAQDVRSLGDGVSEQTDFEVGRVYARSALVSVQLGRFIRELGYPARAHHVRNYGIMVVPAAVDCGLGELARCGYLVTRRYGANVRIACVTTDLPLEQDSEEDLGIQDFCRKCLKCAKACPAAAIPWGEKVVVRGVRKWVVEREKCFLYWGAQGHSCAVCQMACPWSKRDTFIHTAVSSIAVHVPVSRRLIVEIDSLLYRVPHRPGPEN
jgi:reductive dehalogenase